ncbi:hypothetical protein H4R22_003835, partial [Coemansia sp. RSA 1290]
RGQRRCCYRQCLWRNCRPKAPGTGNSSSRRSRSRNRSRATLGAGQRHQRAAQRADPPDPVEQHRHTAGVQQRRWRGADVADDAQRHMARDGGCVCGKRI